MLSFFHRDSAQVPEAIIRKHADTLDEYRQFMASVSRMQDYLVPESSVQVPFDYKILPAIHDVTQRLCSSVLKYVVVIGIGGSNLGAQAVYSALRGDYDLLESKTWPKMLWLDTVSGPRVQRVIEVLRSLGNEHEFAIVVISKSGSTTETVANWVAVREALHEQFSRIDERTVVVTDEGSKLWHAAITHQVEVLPMPHVVGGRFSVFTAVGLLPLALAGIDVYAMQQGAQTAVADAIHESLDHNHSVVSAAILYEQWQQGLMQYNTFLFNPELEDLGKWYRQLMGESLGKEMDESGNQVRRGITPLVSIGSTDLHSMGQLYFGGPRDKFTTLVYHIPTSAPMVHAEDPFQGLVPGIAGKNLADIMHAIVGGVTAAYRQAGLPFTTIAFGELNAGTLGYYLQTRMMEIMYLAHLMEVNAFDQPAVEDYKRETRHLLTSVEQ